MAAGADDGGKHTVLEHLVEMLQMFHDWRSMLFEDTQSYEEVEIAAVEIGPETFPQGENVVPGEFPLVPD